jgi:hypothetical protein
LKLKYDELLLSSAFKFNLRRFKKVLADTTTVIAGGARRLLAGAYTRSHFS